MLSYDRTRVNVEEEEKKELSVFWKNIIWAIVLITLIAIFI